MKFNPYQSPRDLPRRSWVPRARRRLRTLLAISGAAAWFWVLFRLAEMVLGEGP